MREILLNIGTPPCSALRNVCCDRQVVRCSGQVFYFHRAHRRKEAVQKERRLYSIIVGTTWAVGRHSPSGDWLGTHHPVTFAWGFARERACDSPAESASGACDWVEVGTGRRFRGGLFGAVGVDWQTLSGGISPSPKCSPLVNVLPSAKLPKPIGPHVSLPSAIHRRAGSSLRPAERSGAGGKKKRDSTSRSLPLNSLNFQCRHVRFAHHRHLSALSVSE